MTDQKKASELKASELKNQSGDQNLHTLSHLELQARCMALRDENILLMDHLCSLRGALAEAQAGHMSSRYHALRWAAQIAQFHCLYGDGLAYPSAIGADIADRITQEMTHEVERLK